ESQKTNQPPISRITQIGRRECLHSPAKRRDVSIPIAFDPCHPCDPWFIPARGAALAYAYFSAIDFVESLLCFAGGECPGVLLLPSGVGVVEVVERVPVKPGLAKVAGKVSAQARPAAMLMLPTMLTALPTRRRRRLTPRRRQQHRRHPDHQRFAD